MFISIHFISFLPFLQYYYQRKTTHFPHHCLNDFCRLDMGHLSLQGLVSQGKTNTMRWTVAFTSMSADMPYAISDMYIGHIDDQLSEQSAACLRQVLDSREVIAIIKHSNEFFAK